MRVRLPLVLLTLVVLAFAGLRPDAAPEARDAMATHGQLDAQPTPDADAPAALTAGVRHTASLQTAPVSPDRPSLHPSPTATPATRTGPTPTVRTTRPLTFPLLI